MPRPEQVPCDEPFREVSREARATTTHFGPWWLDRSTLTLNLLNEAGGHEWQLDLAKRTTNDVALNWLAEFQNLRWATPEQLGWLTLALNQLLPPKPGESNPRQRLGGLGWL